MSKRWMERLGFNEFSTYRWSFEEDVMSYRAHGFGAIGLWRAKLSDYGEEKAVELLTECGLNVSSLHWAGGFTGSDGRSFRESLHDALDAVEVAAQLKAESLIVVTGGRFGHTRNHVNRIVRDALTELSEAAQAVGVSLAVEPMHAGCSFECSFLNDVPSTLDMIAQIGASNVGIVFDCYHLAQQPLANEWLAQLVPFIRLVQLGDAKSLPVCEQNRCLLGEGNIPLEKIIQVFESNGYKGYYEIELCGQEVEHHNYEYLLQQSHRTASHWLSSAVST